MMKFRYVFYHVKALLKKRETWVLIATIIFLIFVYNGITLPSSDNTSIGVVLSDSSRASSIASIMENKTSLYTISEYKDIDSLKTDVLSGKIECGFIFSDDFDKLMERGKLKDTVKYIYSPYTTKGIAIKETVSSAILEEYSDEILKKQYSKMFGSQDPELKSEILSKLYEQNHYYLDGNDIFEVDFE